MIAFGSPVDIRVGLPLGMPGELAEAAAGVLAEGLRSDGGAGVDEPHPVSGCSTR